MCGIFGIFSNKNVSKDDLKVLSNHAQRRGRDSSGIVLGSKSKINIHKADYPISKVIKKNRKLIANANFVLGHSRLITNGLQDNQPVVTENAVVVHNGIIINHDEIWKTLSKSRQFQIDSEAINGLVEHFLEEHDTLEGVGEYVLSKCKGVVATAVFVPSKSEVVLFSNNGSLYIGEKEGAKLFSSEEYPLKVIGCRNIEKVTREVIVDVHPTTDIEIDVVEENVREHNIIPELAINKINDGIIEFNKPKIKRCTKCILPETMPFIKFDEKGVCNYCNNYVPRNKPKPKSELFELIEPFRKAGNKNDCIVPFSGGRDSCYGLDLIVNELGMKPITYTYDWGMVTDLGRRNISLMCGELGVENIIIAADIEKKRDNIKKNIKAWLKAPHLGMISIFTAGDKHFFRYVEDVKEQTDITLNLWGVNPLEVTHFKAGFLGFPPDFEEDKVYNNGAMKQLRYQKKRFKAMAQSPGYFNSSLWDTLSGEYYRSFHKKSDYFHIFDYWAWDEGICNSILDSYGWERAIDTPTTWRIGDGTAAFYNYIYYTVAGFSEHDTFRSNQIREGAITRDEALALVEVENFPRYPNLKWYLDAVGLDYESTIKTINSIPKLYKV